MTHRALFIIISACFLISAGLQAQSVANLVDGCASQAGEDATYLRDFQVILGEAQPGQRPPVARYPLVLSKNNIYRFSICTGENSTGKGILQLYDSNRLIFSSYVVDTGEEYNPFNFMCQKTGIYHVFITFVDGRPGEAVGILSYVNK